MSFRNRFSISYTSYANLLFFAFSIHNFQTSASNRSQILIKSVEPSISGKYSCEISADAPSFHTSIVGGEMEVVGKWKLLMNIYWEISKHFVWYIYILYT